MRPEELSRQLREGSGEFLARRRKVAGLALAAAGSMGLISLYQLGIIKHLPDPPLPGFDSDKVDAAAEAYSWFQTSRSFIVIRFFLPVQLSALSSDGLLLLSGRRT